MNFSDYSYQFACVLHHERLRKGLSQSRLARRTEIPQSVISKYEAGRANPSLKNLVTLADFFGIRISEFFLSRRSTSKLLPEIPNEGVELPGVSILFEVIESGEEIHREIPRLRQIAIFLRAGKAAVKAQHLEQMKLLEAGNWLILPGGGKITIAGIDEGPSEVQLFESERVEARGLEG